MVKVSVIIPTCNRANIIYRCIQSVVAQTYKDFEILIIDDGSIDNTAEIVKGFEDSRIRYIKHQVQLGANAARNTGMKLAKGEYIAFLDDDDEWLATKLFKQVSLMESSKGSTGAIYTGRKIVSVKREISAVLPIYNGNIFSKLLESNCVGTLSTVMVKRNVIFQIGGFDEKLPSCQDWDLWLRIAKHFEFASIPEILVNYYVTEKSITSNVQKQLLGHLQLFNKHREYFRNGINPHYYLRLGELFCLSGEMSVGRRYFIEAFALNLKSYNILLHLALSFFGNRLFIKLHSSIEKSRLSYIISV